MRLNLLSLRSLTVCLLLMVSASVWGKSSVAGRFSESLDGDWHLYVDKNAQWENDTLYLPSEVPPMAQLPLNPPTGGWNVLTQSSIPVTVPGSVEQFCTKKVQPSPDDSKGVSWWWRTFSVPADQKGKRVILHFQSVRMRAEVFVDRQLVGYDIIGETPFSCDITDAIKWGQDQTLAVRVTNPGGNFHWQDYVPMNWGKYQLPPSRGFSGIIGNVTLQCVPEDMHIDDLYVLNTPDLKKVKVHASLVSAAGKKKDARMQILVRRGDKVLFDKTFDRVKWHGDTANVVYDVECPDAEIWDLDNPNLYLCEARLLQGKKMVDNTGRKFGFRWFAPEGVGEDAILTLNGKRIVLRSAISWGYYPMTGLTATKEISDRQVKVARALGQNMMNFHRCIGQPEMLNSADSLGLLMFEEPGSFQAGKTPFAMALIEEKVKRMVRRDRSHPSLVIYNMMNEYNSRDDVWDQNRLALMRNLHNEYDPSRTMTFASAWAGAKDIDQKQKANLLPYETELRMHGWWDNHRAGGEATYIEGYYKSPADNYMFSDNLREIYMRGEEGAISTPPRLELIQRDIAGRQGWDSRFWEEQYKAFLVYFRENNLWPYFHSIDSLTSMMGRVQLDHQGRRIMSMRMQNIGDIYVVNGWESMPYDNHSGIVDIWRYPKSDPAVMAYYNQPLYIAVMPRQQVAHVDDKVLVDFYIINEKDIKGDFNMEISLRKSGETDPVAGFRPITKRVHLTGGNRYGELLAEAVEIVMPKDGAMYEIVASIPGASQEIKGRDQLLVVDWNKDELLKGNGAIYGESQDQVAQFYEKATGKPLPAFSSDTKNLDWLIVDRSSFDEPELIPASAFADPDGNGKPVTVTWFTDNDIHDKAGESKIDRVDVSFASGAQPAPCLPANQVFSATYDMDIMPQKTGLYQIGVEATAGVRLYINGEQKLDAYWNKEPYKNSTPVYMEEGKPVHVRVGYYQHTPSGSVKLLWSTPGSQRVSPQEILDRAKNDGTTVVVLGKTETWMSHVAQAVNDSKLNPTPVKINKIYTVGKNWVGGLHFVKDHPLFDGLPVNCAMDWPYQAVVEDGDHRFSFDMEGAELVVGSYRSWPFYLGTAVGVIPYGKGQIIFSTLNIPDQLNSDAPSADVARRILLNYLNFKPTSVR